MALGSLRNSARSVKEKVSFSDYVSAECKEYAKSVRQGMQNVEEDYMEGKNMI